MRLLELFKGTGSVGLQFKKMYPKSEVVSLDMDPSCNATHACDIMDWDYTMYKPSTFTHIWASPECKWYSQLMRPLTGRRKKDGTPFITHKQIEVGLAKSDAIVKRVLQIISYFNPQYWFIENPRTGLLKTREFMKALSFVDVDYCMYSDWGYKKQTRIWTNKTTFVCSPKKCNKKCGNIVDGRHTRIGGPKLCLTKSKTYRVPQKILHFLFR